MKHGLDDGQHHERKSVALMGVNVAQTALEFFLRERVCIRCFFLDIGTMRKSSEPLSRGFARSVGATNGTLTW